MTAAATASSSLPTSTPLPTSLPHARVWKGHIDHQGPHLQCPLVSQNHAILDELELWTSHRHSMTKIGPKINKLSSIGYIDPTKLPLWMVSGGILRVFTGSQITKDFFQALVNCSSSFPTADSNSAVGNLGLLTEVVQKEDADQVKTTPSSSSNHRKPPQYLLFFIEWISSQSPVESSSASSPNVSSPTISYQPIVCAAPLSIDVRYTNLNHNLSTIKREPESSPRFLAISLPSSTTTKTSRIIPTPINPLDKPIKPRSSTPFQMAVARKSVSTTHKDSIYKPALSTNSVESPEERRIKSLVQRVVMAELRLRGITKDNNAEFNQLYSQAYKAACFSVRKRYTSKSDESNELTEIQDKVDRLLTIFIGY